MSKLFVSAVVVVALFATATPVAAGKGVTYDKLAYLTFNVPVQVPGAVLGAGTYRFHLANADTSRNVLQIISSDSSVVYAMFQTIPDRRTTLTPEPFVTFRETPADVPPALRSLFYGWEYGGYEFVYPRGEPILRAGPAPQPEITFTTERLESVAETVIEPAVEPEPVVEPVAEVVAAEPVAPPVTEPPVEELARTASPLPLAVFGGVVSLLAGLGFGLLRRRTG